MLQSNIRSVLRDRLHAVEARLRAACQRVGRPRGDVTLVAVTKTVSVEVAGLLPELGVVNLGESRPQELWHKAATLSAGVTWHLVGHLQRNKIERTVPLVRLIHSVDSLRLLEALEQDVRQRQRPIDALLEINASGEASKHGFTPQEAVGVAPRLQELQHVHIRGFMTMAAHEEEPERCRPTFATLRNLRDVLRGKVGPPHRLEHLSMGMTNDFEVAVEEGATLVRIGTALFEGLP